MEEVQIFTKKEDIPKNTRILDVAPRALRELFLIRNPKLKFAPKDAFEAAFQKFLITENIATVFIFFPWEHLTVHTVNEDAYFELRTARNRNIITIEEQNAYRNSAVGIVGLSVGHSVVGALVLSGGPKHLKIADYDVIDATNLNRLRAPVYAIGTAKAEFAAYEVWKIDPFAKLSIWKEGVARETLEKFIAEDPKIDVFIDEMDSLDLKLFARLICRAHKIPVLMATDNGDSIILDVERFDEEPDRKILHGLVEGLDPTQLQHLSYPEWLKIATRIVDPQNLTERVRESLKEIGKTLVAVPQLGTTATIAGAAAAYGVRKITTRQHFASGRYIIDLDYALCHRIL